MVLILQADATQFHRHPGATVKGSGTCPSGTDKPPRKATSIATLNWETVPEPVRHRLPDALRSIGPRRKAPAH